MKILRYLIFIAVPIILLAPLAVYSESQRPLASDPYFYEDSRLLFSDHWEAMRRIEQRMQALMESAFEDSLFEGQFSSRSAFVAPWADDADVDRALFGDVFTGLFKDIGDAYELHLPGERAKNVEIKAEEGRLMIASRHEEISREESAAEGYRLSRQVQSASQRVLPIPADADPSGMRVETTKDGILIRLPKRDA